MSIEIFTADHKGRNRWEFTVSEDSAATITVIGRRKHWFDKDTQEQLPNPNSVPKLLTEKWDFARIYNDIYREYPDLTGTWASPV